MIKKGFFLLSFVFLSYSLFAKNVDIFNRTDRFENYKEPCSSITLSFRPIYLVPVVDFNMTWCTNRQFIKSTDEQGNEVIKEDFNKLRNYLGFRVGAGVFPTLKTWIMANIALTDRIMFNQKNGLVLNLVYESTIHLFQIYGEIKYTHLFTPSFGINVGILTPLFLRMRFIAPYTNNSATIDDLVSIMWIGGIYDVFSLGFELHL